MTHRNNIHNNINDNNKHCANDNKMINNTNKVNVHDDRTDMFLLILCAHISHNVAPSGSGTWKCIDIWKGHDPLSW